MGACTLSEHREHAIAVIKGILQVVDQLRLRARGIVCSLDTNGGFAEPAFLSPVLNVLALEVGLPIDHQTETRGFLLWRNGHQKALAITGNVKHGPAIPRKLFEYLGLTQFKAFASRCDLNRNYLVTRIHVKEFFGIAAPHGIAPISHQKLPARLGERSDINLPLAVL